MKRFNPMFLKMGGSAVVWDKPDEGTPGGDDEAAKAAAAAEAQKAKEAEDAAAIKAAEDAEKQAKIDADAAAEAAKGGTEAEKALAKEKADLLAEVMDKKKKLKSAQDAEADAKAKLALYGDATPEKVAQLLKAEKVAEQESLEAKGEFDRVKEMMASEHDKEATALKTRIEELETAAAEKDGVIDELTVGRSFSDSTFIKEGMLLPPSKVRILYGDHVGMQDGKAVVFDKPSKAKDRTAMVDANGNILSFDEGIKRLVEADPDKNTMIKTKKAPGSGSRSPAPGGKTKPKDTGVTGAARIAKSLADAGEI